MLLARHTSPAPPSCAETRRSDNSTIPSLTPLLSAAARAVQRAHEPEGDYYARLARRIDIPDRIPASVYAPATVSSSAEAERGLAQDLREVINLQRAPPLRLSTFGGNVLEYPAFVASLRNCLEPAVRPGQGLTPRLLEVLTGEAREVVGEVQLLPDGEGYQLAKDRLEARYGQPSLLADRWRHKLSAFSSNSCRAWANKVTACVDALSVTGNIDRMGRGKELQAILQRVPEKARNAFADLDNKARLHRRTQPGLIDLLEILEEQMRKEEARDAYRPRKAREDDAEERHSKRRRREEPARSVLATIARADICPVCHDHRHYIEQCKQFWPMSVQQRREHVKRSRLCFACLRPGHRASACTAASCNLCHSRHHIALHSDRHERPAAASSDRQPPAPDNQPPNQNRGPGNQERRPDNRQSDQGRSNPPQGNPQNNSNNNSERPHQPRGNVQAGFRRRRERRARNQVKGKSANLQKNAPSNN